MALPAIGLILIIRIDMFPSDQGGRPTPIRTGFRPVCLVNQPDGKEVLVGLCELHLTGELHPGDSGDGRLSFDVAVADLAGSLMPLGSLFLLAEGRHPIASAEVIGIER